MRQLQWKKFGCFVAFAICAISGGCAESPEDRLTNIMQNLTYCHDQMIVQWEAIDDEASLKTATPAILMLAEQEGQLVAQMDLVLTEISSDGQSTLTEAEKQRLKGKTDAFKKQSEEGQLRLAASMKRVSNIAGGFELMRQMLKAQKKAIADYKAYNKPALSSSVPSLEVVDQQCVASLQKLCDVLKTVKKKSDAQKAVKQIAPIAAELKENVASLVSHHRAATCAYNAQQAVNTMDQINRLGKELRSEFARISELECDEPIFDALRDLQLKLQNAEKTVRSGFVWRRKTQPVTFADEDGFLFAYWFTHNGRYAGPPPTSWQNLEEMLIQKSQRINWSKKNLEDFLGAVRNCRKHGYVVRWGTVATDEGSHYHVFTYTKETPVTGGNVCCS